MTNTREDFVAGILSAVGNTPLVQLRRLAPVFPLRVFGKIEALNPAGSSKDRAALAMLREALMSGLVTSASEVIESSSGNMGIALAQTCRFLGIRFTCVVDVHAQAQNVRILEAYGAEVVRVVEPDPETGEWLPARLARIHQLLASRPNAIWLEQYRNRQNPLAHYATFQEIVEELDGKVDFVFCGTSTCGTVTGFAEYASAQGLATQVIAVDALGSAIFGSPKRKRLLPGLGAGVVPPHCDPSLLSRIIHVSDLDCVRGCRRLVDTEAILVGASSGGVVSAFLEAAPTLPEGATCVLVFHDRGERYLDTVFSDEWVRRHFGDFALPRKELCV